MRLPWPMLRSTMRYLALLALCMVAHAASVPGALASDALPGTGPVVTWQMPTPATFPAYANITLKVNATEVGGTIANVMFFYSVGSAGKIIGTVTSSSSTYSLVWPNVAPGTYSVGALALDTANVRRGAPPLTIIVGAGTPPPSPSLGRLLGDSTALVLQSGAGTVVWVALFSILTAGPCLFVAWTLLRPFNRGQAWGRLLG